MSFKIVAEIVSPKTGKREPGTGSYVGEKETAEKLLHAARTLRDQGLHVTVYSPDGSVLNEDDHADRT